MSKRKNTDFFLCLFYSHEKGHPEFSSLVTDNAATSPESKEDHLCNYHRGKLVLGLTLLEFDDSIKEGDGKRLHDLYRFALLLFKAHHKTKYSYVVLLHLVKIAGALSEKDAHNLMWNRFFNKGGNIPLDLQMEQMNKIVKTMWKALGANLNEESAEQIANTIEPVELILDAVDNDSDRKQSIGYRSSTKQEDAVSQITKDLMQIKAFHYQQGRLGHPSFLDFNASLLMKLDYRDFHGWMKDHIKLWDSVFSLRHQ